VDDLVQWLREQIADTRYDAERGYLHSPLEHPAGSPAPGETIDPMRLSVVRLPPTVQPIILAQCDAHDAILDLIVLVLGADRRMDAVRHQMLQALGLAYQHHPGYRDEWRPT
jgi:hypothetical protein